MMLASANEIPAVASLLGDWIQTRAEWACIWFEYKPDAAVLKLRYWQGEVNNVRSQASPAA